MLAPLFVSFLASQFGLYKLPDALRKVIGYVPNKIENALRKGLQAFAKRTGGGTAVKEKNSSLTTNKGANGAATDEFTYGGKQYRLVVSAESAGGTVVKIVDKATGKLVGKPLQEEHFTTAAAKQEFRELLTKADELLNKAKKPAAGQPRPNTSYARPMPFCPRGRRMRYSPTCAPTSNPTDRTAGRGVSVPSRDGGMLICRRVPDIGSPRFPLASRVIRLGYELNARENARFTESGSGDGKDSRHGLESYNSYETAARRPDAVTRRPPHLHRGRPRWSATS